MNWLTLLDFSSAWNFFLSKTQADNLDVELLKWKLEFVEKANTILDNISGRYNLAIGSIVALVGISLGLFYFFTDKTVKDATDKAAKKIEDEVDKYIGLQVKIEIDNVRRTLEKERIISETIVDYYFPCNESEPIEYELLDQRGFKEVRFFNHKKNPEKPLGDVLVLDLKNLINFSELSQEDKDEIATEHLTEVKDWIKNLKKTVLVVYVPGRINVLDNLLLPEKIYYTAVNTLVTLMGIVADSAYVAYGEKNK